MLSLSLNTGAGNMVWQRRWVVLTGCRMTYYKDKAESIRPQGTIWLIGNEVEAHTDVSGATSIALQPLPGGLQKGRLLCGETRRMNELWLAAINEAHAAALAKGSQLGFLWLRLGNGGKASSKKVWRRRWIVLDGLEETIFTFNAPDESDHQEEFIITGCRLEHVKSNSVRPEEFSYLSGDKIDPFPFSLHLMNGEVVVLCAESRREEQSWRQAFTTCALGDSSQIEQPVLSPMFQHPENRFLGPHSLEQQTMASGLEMTNLEASGERRLSSGDDDNETKEIEDKAPNTNDSRGRNSSSIIVDLDDSVDYEDDEEAHPNTPISDFGDAIYEGYLLKKGGGTSVVGRRNWKKRYFVLYLDHLVYYKEKDGAILGKISLSGCELRIMNRTKYEWHFIIETPNLDGGRAFQLRALEKGSFENWRDYLSAST